MVARNRIVLSGTLAGGTEEWSTGVAFGGAGVTQDLAEVSQWATGIANALPTFLTGTGLVLSGLLSDFGTVGLVRVYGYAGGPDAPAQVVGEAITDIEGDGAVRCPTTTAVVASLRTGVPGASYRGRIYWPGQGAQVTGEGMLGGTAGPSQLAQAFSALLELLAAASPNVGTVFPGVYSGTKDLITPVIEVAVGSVPDSQRRRRDDLIESYAVAPYEG